MTPSHIRIAGAVVAAGGITWGASWIFRPSRPDQNDQVEIWASLPFQIGLLALLGTIWATRAVGNGRWARGILAAEIVAVALATAWTVPYLFDANRPNTGILAILDPFWPLSMLGIIAVGILVVRARRWSRSVRYLPLAAGLLLPVDIAFFWLPDRQASVVTGVYLAVAYGVLGLAMIREAAALSARIPAHASTS